MLIRNYTQSRYTGTYRYQRGTNYGKYAIVGGIYAGAAVVGFVKGGPAGTVVAIAAVPEVVTVPILAM